MIARVLQVEVGPDQVDAVVEAYRDVVRPIHEQAAGLRSHYVLANRATGIVQIIGVWESAEAVAAIAPALEPARARLWAQFGRAPILEIYEVADELIPGR
jgi:heme-degrading monooxygenase HmoA